jgi:hypothetical protein
MTEGGIARMTSSDKADMHPVNWMHLCTCSSGRDESWPCQCRGDFHLRSAIDARRDAATATLAVHQYPGPSYQPIGEDLLVGTMDIPD